MNAPAMPRCTLARFQREEMNVEAVKREGWNDHRILVVSADDARLTWIERQIIETIGKKLYGKRGRG